LICLSDLSNARFFATLLELKINRVVQDYLFGLGWSDSMLGYVVDVGVVPIEHLQTFLAPLSGLSLTAPVGGW